LFVAVLIGVTPSRPVTYAVRLSGVDAIAYGFRTLIGVPGLFVAVLISVTAFPNSLTT
jgi:hypothetical protein